MNIPIDQARVEAEIEDIILYLSLARERKYSQRALRVFDGSLPMFSDSALEELAPEGERDLLPPEDMLPTSIGSWDVSIISWPAKDDHDPAEPDRRPKFHLGRFRSASPKEVRGKVCISARHYVEQCAGFVYDDGEYWGAGTYFGWYHDKWRPLAQSRHDRHAASAPEVVSNRIRIAQSVAFAKRRWWQATLRLDDGPSLALPTDPIGAQELFRLRDLPEGRSRRAALIHWVAEHWRKSRKDPTVEAKVRAHLRGATDFEWNGLSVKLTPSRADLDRAEATRPKGKKG